MAELYLAAIILAPQQMDSQEDIPKGSLAGRRIGVYRLEEEVGRGGMGVIYRAARADGEFDQTVAIKLIKRGMDTDAILDRFKRERRITAALNHPNIAYFYGGGSTDEGLPYFVMEYITGLPLYRYCDENRLNVRERLSIFRQVCWAVEAAHQKMVVHRDLKPSNIMVSTEGKPKLLDFGIAKILDAEPGSTDDIATATQLRMMTPEYASPEQVSGEDVTAATDVYSLGIILYELLTGHRPYKVRRGAPDEVARMIREEMPTSPSGSITRPEDLVDVGGHAATLEEVVAARNSTVDDLRRELSGDLDRIILKAIRKEPAERYPSAAALANDISNFLEHRPVDAEFFASLANMPRPRTADKLAVAILPFRIIGPAGSTNTEFVGIGLADALISRLSGVRRLVVRPTTSVLRFAEAVPYVAAKELGVDFVVDGTVRIVGDRIRLSVQLYSASEDSTRWAHAFDENTSDVLELEDSLAEQLTRAVLPHLTSDERSRLERRGTNRPAAYEAYIRGRYFVNRFTGVDLSKAVDCFKEAISIDPDYALPYIGLADYYAWSAIFGEIPSKEAFPLAEAAARRALEIDNTMGEAYAALAFCVLLHDWNWADAEYLAKRAIEFTPNYGFAHEVYSNFLCAQGQFDEAVNEIQIAQELDPFSPRAYLMTSWTLYQARRFEEAVTAATKGNNMQPDFPQGLLHLGNCLTAAGRHDQAVSVLRKSAEHWGDAGMPRYMLAFARVAQGNLEAAHKILGKLVAAAERRYVKPYFIGMCYAAVGDRDNAFIWFERAADEGNEWMIWFGVDPKLDAIREDPRYLRILAKTNNPLANRKDARDTGDPTTGAARERSIAVLPFHMVRSTPDQDSAYEYLSLGLADALTMRLSNLRRFVVRPTSSVLPFQDPDIDPFDAGRELGVEFVVDGIIRLIGPKLRLTVQLLDVNESSVRWASSYSEEFCDILELEDSLSEQITRQLLPKLSGDEEKQIARRGTNNAAAYEAYLQGKYFWNRFEPSAFPKSIAAFERAVELDPEFALAHVGIADFNGWAAIYGMLPSAEAAEAMAASARRALELDPSLAEAYAALGLYHSNKQQWDEAKEKYRRSIELNANYPLSHEWYSSILVATGETEHGIEELKIAERLDPLSFRPKILTAWTLYQARRYDAALEKAREMEQLDPDVMQTHLQTANILSQVGDFDEAVRHSSRAVELEPDASLPVYVHCFALAGLGRADEAAGLIQAWEKRSAVEYVPPFFLGMSRLAIGDIDRALSYFDAARLQYSAWTVWYSTEPKLDSLRSDERFRRLIRLMNGPIPID